MARTDTVFYWVEKLEAEGCTVEHDHLAGTVRVKDDGEVVYMALQKGFDGPWIVACYNTPRMTWNEEEVAEDGED
jgi:hypothetical protein